MNVVENTTAGIDIGSPVTATDPDDGDTLTYSLDTGDGSAFDIDSSGQIKTKGALDRETKDSYTVTVTASDDGGANATHDVTITVDNEVEPPTFNDGDAGTTRTIDHRRAPVGDPVSRKNTYSLDDQRASFDIAGKDQGDLDRVCTQSPRYRRIGRTNTEGDSPASTDLTKSAG